MPLELYGVPMSQPFRAVWSLLKYKGVEPEVKFTMPASNKENGSQTPEFKKMNPSGLVPVLKDGDFTLFESHAIMVYLAQKYGWTDLYPSNLQARAKVDEYLHWHHHFLRKVTLDVIRPVLVLRKPPGELSPPAKKALSLLNDRLVGGYVCGNSLTLADFAAYCEIDQVSARYFGLVDLSVYPNILTWIETMSKLQGHDEARQMLEKFSAKMKKAPAKL
eukprot:NODE_1560_length_812_cov_95.248175_g1512_i0.p1 GENE.NODE_1560_length_812_cov_95.248175_g1512_i0~~NODE_1560_length_812_cov_95.248175_g1512_i0.p1  ORF type:complete len:219 (+),score=28.20 NODE_1560_length_812_cov_95.248175_g1512_i0:76-732(+)